MGLVIQAQQTADPSSLTLPQAVRIALEKNPLRKAACRNIFSHSLLVIQVHCGYFGFEALQQFHLSIRGSKIRTSGNVASSCPDLRVKPDQIQIDLVRFDEILVIAVE